MKIFFNEASQNSCRPVMRRSILSFLGLILSFITLNAEVVKDSVSIHFRQSSDKLDLSRGNNRENLDRIVKTISERGNDSVYTLRGVLVVGAASPEGSVKYNYDLSRRRANTLFDYIRQYSDLPDSVMQFRFLGRDWRGLARLVKEDPSMPFADETAALINDIADEAEKETPMKTDPVRRLKLFKAGIPYKYMYSNLFPTLRTSRMYLTYDYQPEPEVKPVEVARPVVDIMEYVETVEQPDTVEPKPFYMALKTNMLYDALLVPNIGVEFYLGKNISLAANWMYAWWKCDHKHNYWRTYGGDVELRWWFGSKAHAKPLTGHHIGLYGQMLTYDVELGDRGYLGPRWSYGGGISYGYSFPVARRINIDLSLGVGYLGGEYKEYLPIDGHYVWQATKNRHWFGPTKAEVSFVWLIGRGNVNK